MWRPDWSQIQKSACLYLLSAEVKDSQHYTLPCLFYVTLKSEWMMVEQDLGWEYGAVKGFGLKLHGKRSFIFLYKSHIAKV